jgi:hypothetical protein
VSFALQSMVLEYVTDRLVETAADEIERGQPVVLLEQPLIKAQAKEYVRQAQERLIGTPILQRLKAHHDERGTEQRLLLLLEGWRVGRRGAGSSGNVVNLLRRCGVTCADDLSGLDSARGPVEEARELASDTTSPISCLRTRSLPRPVALSHDGALLAAGTPSGQVWLWRKDRTPVAVQGHSRVGWPDWRRRIAGRGHVDRAGLAVAGGRPHGAVGGARPHRRCLGFGAAD